MKQTSKPPIRLFLTREAFNTLWSMLRFYVASETQAGKTFYSELATKFMQQFVRFGNFVEKKTPEDDIFMILLYDSEVMKLMRLYNKYITVHTQPPHDFFSEIMADKKSRTQCNGVWGLPHPASGRNSGS